MKKLLSILLIAIYSTAALGMSVKEFYCCGKLSSVSISFNADAKQSKDGCCKTTLHLLKVKTTHLNTTAIAVAAKHAALSDIHLPVFDTVAYGNPQLDVTSGIHDPPIPGSSTPIYILTRNFRI